MTDESPMAEYRNRILGGGYKLLFLGLTLPVGIVLLGWIVRIIESHLKFLNSDPEIIFIYLTTTILAAGYVGLYFVYPYKPDFVSLVVPVLIMLIVATNWTKELYCLSAATILSLVIQIDIFDDRRLAPPHLQSSLYWQKVKGKPHHKKTVLQTNIGSIRGKEKAILVVDLWKHDFEYLINKEMVAFRKQRDESDPERNFELYQSPRTGSSFLVASRRAIEDLPRLLKLQQKGFEICVSQKLLRSFFFKYDVRFPIGNKVRIGQINFTVI